MLAACVRRALRLRATTCRSSLRHMSTEELQPEFQPELEPEPAPEPKLLKTQQDWNDFQLRRAEQEVLGTFRTLST